MSRSPVPGDPASVSSMATVTLAAGRLVGGAGQALTSLTTPPSITTPTDSSEDDPQTQGQTTAPGHSRAKARSLARRRATLTAAAAAAGDELTVVGRLLQTHTTDLADQRRTLAALVARGERGGLTLTDGRWTRAWGITGSADSDQEAAAADLVETLQRELDGLVRVATRRRRALITALTSSREHMEHQAAQVRRG